MGKTIKKQKATPQQNTKAKYYLIGTNAIANYDYPDKPPCDGCGSGPPHYQLGLAAAKDVVEQFSKKMPAPSTSQPSPSGDPIVDNRHPVIHPIYGGIGKWVDTETGVMGPFSLKKDAENWLDGTLNADGTRKQGKKKAPEFAYRYTNIVCLCVSVI